MPITDQILLALDIGEKRIGVAWCDTVVRVASPLAAIAMDDNAVAKIVATMRNMNATTVVVGLPRNQSGDETKQSQYARNFAKKLENAGVAVKFQDESVTSIIAENRLRERGKPYDKSDIDSEAAAIILTDYIEANHG